MLATLKVGEMWYRTGSERHFLAVAMGFVEILPDRVTILAQVGERAQDIDVARAERAKQRAEGRIAGSTAATDIDLERARIALMKSLIRLQVAAKVRMRS